MNPKVYVESSVVSYLANRDSRDIVVLAQQQITREWWIDAAKSFDLYVSDLVIDEVSRGASDAANARVQAVAKASVLSLDAEVQNLEIGRAHV